MAKHMSRTVTMEHLDVLLNRISSLMQQKRYEEARKLAADKLAELRVCWGYGMKNKTEETYMRSFMYMRAECCRRLQGIDV